MGAGGKEWARTVTGRRPRQRVAAPPPPKSQFRCLTTHPPTTNTPPSPHPTHRHPYIRLHQVQGQGLGFSEGEGDGEGVEETCRRNAPSPIQTTNSNGGQRTGKRNKPLPSSITTPPPGPSPPLPPNSISPNKNEINTQSFIMQADHWVAGQPPPPTTTILKKGNVKTKPENEKKNHHAPQTSSRVESRAKCTYPAGVLA
jgi:hypothetical protein